MPTIKQTLRRLPPEPWGERMSRARRLHHISQEQAAEMLSRYITTTGATISRLESLPNLPASVKRRQLAWTLCVMYGIDPRCMELGPDDRPPAAVTDAVLADYTDTTSPRIHDPSTGADGIIDLDEIIERLSRTQYRVIRHDGEDVVISEPLARAS